MKSKLVLGIETSCDETAVALVEGRKVIHSLVSSQIELHAKFGGVIPEIAARKHLEVLPHLYQELLTTTKINPDSIDIIAVTQGPGLVGALLVGSAFAKGLALSLNKPLLPVNHVHSHVHGALLGLKEDKSDQEIFPALSLVASGGHTSLFYMKSSTEFELMGQTIDDACGECFDKVAKLLGLSYPGGPVIERKARMGHPKAYKMPRMMHDKKQLNFSYSGLKTHLYYLLKKEKEINDKKLADICASFQENAFEQIGRRLKQALELKPNCKSIIIAGGVSANKRFRELLQEKINCQLFFPALDYCSDNAAMVAAYGGALADKIDFTQQDISKNFNFDVYSRYHQFLEESN